jgi:hypothetical protein
MSCDDDDDDDDDDDELDFRRAGIASSAEVQSPPTASWA